jgi:hypothetical protein
MRLAPSAPGLEACKCLISPRTRGGPLPWPRFLQGLFSALFVGAFARLELCCCAVQLDPLPLEGSHLGVDLLDRKREVITTDATRSSPRLVVEILQDTLSGSRVELLNASYEHAC